MLLYFYPIYTKLGAAFLVAEVAFIGGLGVIEAVRIRSVDVLSVGVTGSHPDTKDINRPSKASAVPIEII